MSSSRTIAVVGAGIGGLTAEVALRQAGFEVDVYEQAPELTEVGGGINMGPNASRILYRLGLGDALDREAVRPLSTHQRRWQDGRTLQRAPLNPRCEELYGAPHLTVHRADLLSIIASGFPAARIHLGHRLVGVADKGDHTEAWFENGGRITADVLVGADGINSTVRECLFGVQPVRFTQQMAWRCIVPIECVPTRVGPGGAVSVAREDYVGWLGPTGHVICYPIRGGALYNIFAGRVSEEWADESWTVPSSIAALLDAYRGWNEALLDTLGQVERCFKWGIYDRDPLPQWSKGAVTLLGDAAHPMMPTLAQGAAITLEDSVALARNIAQHGDPRAALAAYEAERRPRAGQVQLQAREQFQNNRKVPAPPPLSRDWIFAHDATKQPMAV